MKISNFLDSEARATLLNWAMTNRDNFEPSRTSGAGYEAVVNAKFRTSVQLADLGPCREVLKVAIKPRIAEFAEALKLNHRRFKGYEAELVAHNDGAFFKPHIDTGSPQSGKASRLISAVYYFHNWPKNFSGGELRVYDIARPGHYVDYEPEDNSLVLFPAFVPHEVLEVSCPSKAFADSRFAINCWAHRAPEE